MENATKRIDSKRFEEIRRDSKLFETPPILAVFTTISQIPRTISVTHPAKSRSKPQEPEAPQKIPINNSKDTPILKNLPITSINPP